MEIIKVTKTFRNGSITKYLVLYEEVCTKEFAEDCADDWCAKEGNGVNYGYTWEWEFVKDKEEIKEAISKEIDSVTKEIRVLQDKRDKLFTYHKKS